MANLRMNATPIRTGGSTSNGRSGSKKRGSTKAAPKLAT